MNISREEDGVVQSMDISSKQSLDDQEKQFVEDIYNGFNRYFESKLNLENNLIFVYQHYSDQIRPRPRIELLYDTGILRNKYL